jgi:hypothetical protein
MQKKQHCVLMILMLVVLMLITGCKKSSEVSNVPDIPVDPEDPEPTEQLVAKMFYHDTGPQSQYDIFTADLYIVPKQNTAALMENHIPLSGPGSIKTLKRGVSQLHHLEFNGSVKERVAINSLYSTQDIDISQYDFVVKNVENLTGSVTDDFAVNVNNNNWITFVTAPTGLANDRTNTEIVYMDIADRVRQQLTPINGKYSGNNWDPDWKTDNIIVWSHDGQIVEVDIDDLNVSDPIVPDWAGIQYDPKYSPDRTMILFNTRQNRQKNSYIKYLETGQFATVLPQNYFEVYEDDNPTWVFSNSLITGHIFIDGKGRIYTREPDSGGFLIITDGQQDFRYVSPVKLEQTVYLVFSDWTDQSNITLWISNENGTYLRELDQTGDEVVFKALGLPVPRSEEDLKNIALDYILMFEH